MNFLSFLVLLFPVYGYDFRAFRNSVFQISHLLGIGSPLKTGAGWRNALRPESEVMKDRAVPTSITKYLGEGLILTKDMKLERTANQFVRNAVKNVGPSVVRIDCEREISQLLALYTEMKEGEVIKVSGTGIIASSDGYILTNAHVVDQAKKVTVTLSNDRSFRASVIAFDEFTDLAVLKLDVKDIRFTLPSAPFGDSSKLHSGDWVIAVGCPVGLDFTVTLGVVSNPKRAAAVVGVPHLKGSYIQTDAALNSGNSGGPLVNDVGEVIGINTMVRSNTEAIGFAIPINQAKAIYEVLKLGKKPSHAYFGIETMSNTPDSARLNNEDPNSPHIPETSGALVLKVLPNSPAEKSGLRKNDVVVMVNGAPIRGLDDAEEHLDGCKPGKPSTIKVMRGENAVEHIFSVVPQDLHALLEEKRKMPQPMVIIRPNN